jgi:hypothetical protein
MTPKVVIKGNGEVEIVSEPKIQDAFKELIAFLHYLEKPAEIHRLKKVSNLLDLMGIHKIADLDKAIKDMEEGVT